MYNLDKFDEWARNVFVAANQGENERLKTLFGNCKVFHEEAYKNSVKYDFYGARNHTYFDFSVFEPVIEDLYQVLHQVLEIAADKGHWETVKFILNVFENYQELLPSNAEARNICTDGVYQALLSLSRSQPAGFALISAAIQGNTKMAKLLIQKDAKLDTYDLDGNTALIFAASRGHLEIVKGLVEAGADLKTKNYKHRQTALAYAAKNGHLEVVKYLYHCGAKINVLDNQFYTPLLLALENKHFNVVDFLVKRGAKILATNNKGKNILHLATKKGKEKVLQFLYELFMDFELKDSSGNTPLLIAAEANQVNIVRFLISKKINLNSRTKVGNTALMQAALLGHTEVVKLLLENGADVTLKNSVGKTALHLAIADGNRSVVTLLLNAGAELDSEAYQLALIRQDQAIISALNIGRLEKIIFNLSQPDVPKYQNSSTFFHRITTKKTIEAAQTLLEENKSGHAGSHEKYKRILKKNSELNEISCHGPKP